MHSAVGAAGDLQPDALAGAWSLSWHSATVSLQRSAAEIRVRDHGGRWTDPSSYGYVNEAELQQILSEQPSLIEGVGADAVAVRELATSVGRADLVVVDTDGTITIVECKLATDADIRRVIVGQVLDYAARLSELTPATFEELWQARGGTSLDLLFDGQPDDARRAFEANLEAGVFTLVLAVDSISADLRRIVRYLNTHTSAGMRLLAVELRRAVHGDTEILIPTVYGSESADEKNARRSAAGAARWTSTDVDAWLRERDPELADAVASFADDLAAHGFRIQGGGSGAQPSYSIWGTAASGADIAPFSVYCGSPSSLSCNFQWTRGAGPVAVGRFLEELSAAGLPLAVEAIAATDFKKRPGIPLDVLKDSARRGAIVAASGRLSQSDAGD
ncbi:hypothetical protein [Blastococcus sp. TF02A-30]|uniref:hypothetical protein n=1 Tax=Blastococcus sp. TF02A-30 TaxID=2250580 RepID=UPI000DE815C9|nr:hypothetical protein [Blastococcus sp. TF02A-30]RBY91065.1 hypothetical protein DQ241_05165 [Blastococcus sp. TF02A-30]